MWIAKRMAACHASNGVSACLYTLRVVSCMCCVYVCSGASQQADLLLQMTLDILFEVVVAAVDYNAEVSSAF